MIALDAFTAICEICRCDWYHACPGGCGWDRGFWKKRRAVCTACVAKVHPRRTGKRRKRTA